ncbi:MAG: HAD family hydrolase, partial [Pseudooceanicola nanhaiensis]
MMQPRLVIFDVDGTLSDSQGHILAAMADAFAVVDAP